MCQVCSGSGYEVKKVKVEVMKGVQTEYEVYTQCRCKAENAARKANEQVKADPRKWWND